MRAAVRACDSVDPGGVIARSIRARAQRRLRRLLLDRDHRARGDPAHRGHAVHDRRAGRIGAASGARRSPAAFTAGGLKAPVEARLRDQIWLKLIGNVAFNPVTALTRATLGELGTAPEMMRPAPGGLRASARRSPTRLGIRFPVSLDRRLEAGIAVGDHKTSMLQDLEAGKRLELDCMTGAVVELAGRLGIDVPHLRTVHACATLLDQLNQARLSGSVPRARLIPARPLLLARPAGPGPPGWPGPGCCWPRPPARATRGGPSLFLYQRRWPTAVLRSCGRRGDAAGWAGRVGGRGVGGLTIRSQIPY